MSVKAKTRGPKARERRSQREEVRFLSGAIWDLYQRVILVEKAVQALQLGIRQKR